MTLVFREKRIARKGEAPFMANALRDGQDIGFMRRDHSFSEWVWYPTFGKAVAVGRDRKRAESAIGKIVDADG